MTNCARGLLPASLSYLSLLCFASLTSFLVFKPIKKFKQLKQLIPIQMINHPDDLFSCLIHALPLSAGAPASIRASWILYHIRRFRPVFSPCNTPGNTETGVCNTDSVRDIY